jgi:hypothetical protein
VIEIGNTDLLYEAFADGKRLWGALNIADAPVTRTTDADAEKLAGDVAASTKSGKTELTLPPHGWGILG